MAEPISGMISYMISHNVGLTWLRLKTAF